MSNESTRQAYIRLLRETAAAVDSRTAGQRDVVLVSELIRDDCLEGNVTPNGSGFPVRADPQGMKSKGRLLLQQLETEEANASLKKKHHDEFQCLDRTELADMDDKVLAAWQSNFKHDEPQWRVAEYEWQRRITAKQIRAGKWNAGFSLIGVVVGAFLTAYLSANSPFRNPNGSSSPQAQNPTITHSNNQRQTSASASAGHTNSTVKPVPPP